MESGPRCCLRYCCVYSQITYLLLCRILLLSKNCFSWFCHIFCLRIQVELVVVQSLLLNSESLSLKLCSHTCALHHPAELLHIHWVMQFMLCHLSPQAIHSPLLVLLLSFLCYHWWFFLPHTATGLSWAGNGFLTAALLILAWWVSGVSLL